jgi:tRNA uridine 5-carbamoylmethylation protein Kti12
MEISRLIILEGLDGTGKTTLAQKLISFSTYTLPINYIYFPKLETPEQTYEYFEDLAMNIQKLKGIVVMDRSILSTYAYSLVGSQYELNRFELVEDMNPIMFMLNKVYDESKLPNTVFLPQIEARYELALNYMAGWFTIIRGSAEEISNKLKSLVDFEYLLIHKKLWG